MGVAVDARREPDLRTRIVLGGRSRAVRQGQNKDVRAIGPDNRIVASSARIAARAIASSSTASSPGFLRDRNSRPLEGRGREGSEMLRIGRHNERTLLVGLGSDEDVTVQRLWRGSNVPGIASRSP